MEGDAGGKEGWEGEEGEVVVGVDGEGEVETASERP